MIFITDAFHHQPSRRPMIDRFFRGVSFPVSLLTVVFALTAGTAPPLGAQITEEQTVEEADDTQRMEALEQSVRILESRLLHLEERINALLGEEDADAVHDIPLGASPMRGNPDAELTLVVFGDYQSDYTTRSQHAIDRKSTRLNSSHIPLSRMPSSA